MNELHTAAKFILTNSKIHFLCYFILKDSHQVSEMVSQHNVHNNQCELTTTETRSAAGMALL